MNNFPRRPKPPWLTTRLPTTPAFGRTKCLLDSKGLHTVCEEARCPNRWECFSRGTATFLIMGPICTRNCRFCSVASGIPRPLDPDEPHNIADFVVKMGLSYVVLTSVTRDDLSDGGASHFVKVVSSITHVSPSSLVEVLVPDFKGDISALSTVLKSPVVVLNHNVETVPSLYSKVRPGADYYRSLELLRKSREISPSLVVKSGIMVGLGESIEEIEEVLLDLRDAGCDAVTIGQYLQPTRGNLEVVRYYTPEEFSYLEMRALDMGFKVALAGPFVRSSFKARECYEKIRKKKERDYEDRVP